MNFRLADLPPPPAGLQGWPWTEETPLPADLDAGALPKISIVTPNYNMGTFIEKTIRSILLQNYPNLELIVMDGGSTDNSVEIIRKYEPWLAHWVSRKDKGQVDAINRGHEQATGEIWAYMNSDDIYLPGAFHAIARRWLKGEWGKRSENKKLWICGCAQFLHLPENKMELWTPSEPGPVRAMWIHFPWGVPQAASFWEREAFDKYGLWDEQFNYVFDTEFGLRLLFKNELPYLVKNETYAERVVHDGAKSWDLSHFRAESIRFVPMYEGYLTEKEKQDFAQWRQWDFISEESRRIIELFKKGKIGGGVQGLVRLLIKHPLRAPRSFITQATGISVTQKQG